MTAVALIGAAVTLAGTGALLWAVHSAPDRQRLPKMVASTGLLATAIGSGALDTGFGMFVLAGLVLSWFGDLFLTFHGRRLFLAGLGAFLTAHLAYATAFSVRGLAGPATLGAAAVLAATAVFVSRWLFPHVPTDMRFPVLAYVVVITAMSALAFGTMRAAADLRIPIGAAAFFLSDLFVARERFVARAVANQLWGLPLYFLGQLLLARAAGG